MSASSHVSSLGLLIVSLIAYFSIRSLLIAGIGALFIQSRFGRSRLIYRAPFAAGQIRSEAVAGVKVALFDSILLGVVLHFKLIPFAEFTWTNFVMTYSLIYLWYEIWFYFSHRALHHPGLYFIHRQHHVAKVTSPLSAISFSALERTIFFIGALGLPGIVAYFMPLVLEGVIAYGIFNLIVNTLGHSNVEVYPAHYGSSNMAKVFGSPTFHAMHHTRQKGHFGLFTTVLDHVFGTNFPDYPEVQRRAAEGRGLERVSHRLSALRARFSK